MGHLTLAEIADPNPAVQPEISSAAQPAHEANNILVNEEIVHDLRATRTPVCQLRIANTSEMIQMFFVERDSHASCLSAIMGRRPHPNQELVWLFGGHPPMTVSMFVTNSSPNHAT